VPGNRTRGLRICSQELWPLDHRGGLDGANNEPKLDTILTQFRPLQILFVGSLSHCYSYTSRSLSNFPFWIRFPSVFLVFRNLTTSPVYRYLLEFTIWLRGDMYVIDREVCCYEVPKLLNDQSSLGQVSGKYVMPTQVITNNALRKTAKFKRFSPRGFLRL
jgi:hypothetical protein